MRTFLFAPPSPPADTAKATCAGIFGGTVANIVVSGAISSLVRPDDTRVLAVLLLGGVIGAVVSGAIRFFKYQTDPVRAGVVIMSLAWLAWVIIGVLTVGVQFSIEQLVGGTFAMVINGAATGLGYKVAASRFS